MLELFVLGCTGVVVFLHGVNFFFHALSQRLRYRSLRANDPMVDWNSRITYIEEQIMVLQSQVNLLIRDQSCRYHRHRHAHGNHYVSSYHCQASVQTADNSSIHFDEAYVQQSPQYDSLPIFDDYGEGEYQQSILDFSLLPDTSEGMLNISTNELIEEHIEDDTEASLVIQSPSDEFHMYFQSINQDVSPMQHLEPSPLLCHASIRYSIHDDPFVTIIYLVPLIPETLLEEATPSIFILLDNLITSPENTNQERVNVAILEISLNIEALMHVRVLYLKLPPPKPPPNFVLYLKPPSLKPPPDVVKLSEISS